MLYEFYFNFFYGKKGVYETLTLTFLFEIVILKF